MDKKRKLILISAVALGLISVFLLSIYLNGNSSKTPQPRPASQQPSSAQKPQTQSRQTTQVLIARTNIKKGDSLNPRMFSRKSIPLEFAQPMAASTLEDIKDKIALLPVLKGEQLLINKTGSYSDEPAGLSFSMTVPNGKRAVTVVVDSISAAGGMIKTGDYVDVFCNFPAIEDIAGKPTAGIVTTALFQKALVINASAPGESASRRGSSAPASSDVSITLALEPEETGVLLFAQSKGEIFFTLRAPADEKTAELHSIDTQTFYQFVTPQKEESAPQRGYSSGNGIEVFKGIDRE